MSKFENTREVRFVVPSDPYTSMQDFSAFLYRMKSLYTYTLKESQLFDNNEGYLEDVLLEYGDINQLDQSFIDDFHSELVNADFNSRRFRLFSKDLGEEDIYIKKIEDGSFELILSGVALAMIFVFALMVFITGGKMSVSQSEITLEAGTTLGKGLEDLKDFLRK